MKRRTIAVLVVVAGLVAGLAAVAGAVPEYRPGEGSAFVAVSPDADETAGLIFMREEERLARDVYLALGELWDVPIFDRIAASEQRHMDAVLTLLEARGIADPAAGLAPGEFRDPGLQALYDDLLARGSVSLEAAFDVGVVIEEIDIADLEECLEQASSADVVRVFGNLHAGSERHLAAFSNAAGEGPAECNAASAGRGGGRGRRR